MRTYPVTDILCFLITFFGHFLYYFWDVYVVLMIIFFRVLLWFCLQNGVPGACRAAHVDLDGATPRVAMDHGGWAPTKVAGCGYGRNIRKMQLLFEKYPNSILFYCTVFYSILFDDRRFRFYSILFYSILFFVVPGAKMKFLQIKPKNKYKSPPSPSCPAGSNSQNTRTACGH